MDNWLGTLNALIRIGRIGEAATASNGCMILLLRTFAALLAVATLGSMAAAIWIYLLPSLGMGGAALATALALGVLCLVSIGFSFGLSRPGRNRTPIESDVKILTAEVARLFKDNKAALLLAALLCGVFAGQGHRDR